VAAFCLPRLRLFEIASVLVRFDHVASIIANADHKQSGLLTHIAATKDFSWCVPMKS
jgi:hypothetical protein